MYLPKINLVFKKDKVSQLPSSKLGFSGSVRSKVTSSFSLSVQTSLKKPSI